MRRRSGLVVPCDPRHDLDHSTCRVPSGSPTTPDAWREDREPWLGIREASRAVWPSRGGDAQAFERLAIVRRGQILGFGALVLMLATIVTLVAMGQPWVAGSVATAGLAVNVAIFVTGRHPPTSVQTAEAVPHQPVPLPRRDLPGSRPPLSAATGK